MRVLLGILFLIMLCDKSFAWKLRRQIEKTITCADLKDITVIGALFISVSSKKTNLVPVTFYLSTNKTREPVEIGMNDWTALETSNFDPSEKTSIIVHGYKSGGRKPWVLEIKDKILNSRKGNVILVDWSSGSNVKNYVTAARNTMTATNRILNFLQALRPRVEMLRKSSKPIQWNHLYFIGHSLGAQISGQTAHLLKEDGFWRVERITGLDPAKPCFTNVDVSLRIDKEDADFVDIIHTQAGKGGSIDALGLKQSVGHMDFYVNGAVAQPGCLGSAFTPKWDTMICSHKLAYRYFIESFNTTSCKFVGYPWDGTYYSAELILGDKLAGGTCYGCPEMGINASRTNQRGHFFVITSEEKPYCELNPDHLKNVIKVIRRLKGSPVFEDD